MIDQPTIDELLDNQAKAIVAIISDGIEGGWDGNTPRLSDEAQSELVAQLKEFARAIHLGCVASLGESR